jgi:hypothetical protein
VGTHETRKSLLMKSSVNNHPLGWAKTSRRGCDTEVVFSRTGGDAILCQHYYGHYIRGSSSGPLLPVANVQRKLPAKEMKFKKFARAIFISEIVELP